MPQGGLAPVYKGVRAIRDLSTRFLLSRKAKRTMLASALPNFAKTLSNLDDRRPPKTGQPTVGLLDKSVTVLCQAP